MYIECYSRTELDFLRSLLFKILDIRNTNDETIEGIMPRTIIK